MSDRQAGIAARIGSVGKLGMVMRAMRGIAATRLRQAQGQLAAADAYADTLHAALGRVLGRLGAPPAPLSGPATLVVFLAEQGFAGSFSEGLLDRIGRPEGPLVLLGTRGIALAAARGLEPALTRALPAHVSSIPRFADGLARDLLAAGAPRIEAICAGTGAGTGTGPRDALRRQVHPAPVPPGVTGDLLLHLPPEALLPPLFAELLHAELCRLTLQAMVAENDARMRAMAAAENQTARRLEALRAQERRIRQDSITDEILEIAAGAIGQSRETTRH